MNRIPTLCTMLAVVLSIAAPATADVIYDNGHSTYFVTASDFDYPRQVVDDFQLQPGAVTITDVHWWGVYNTLDDPPVSDDFTIRIFADNNGDPEVNPIHEITGVNAGRAPSGSIGIIPEYEYWVDIAPIVLSANTTYWLSIVNDTPNDPDWYWSHGPSGGTGRLRTQDGDSWGYASNEYSFYLTGPDVVPEPASMTLLGIGIAGIALRKRRKA